MTNNLKIDCLNAAGLVKPDKAAFMETVDDFLSTCPDYSHNIPEDTKRLVGQVLRFYQQWPRYRTRMHDLDWLVQAYDPSCKNETLHNVYRNGDRLHVSDGPRIHQIKFEDAETLVAIAFNKIGVVDMKHDNAPDFTSFFPALGQQRPLKLSDFRNVETDLLVWNGFTYLERYILEAFSGNRIMLTPESPHIEHNALLLKSEDGNRAACIAPLRS